MSIEVCERNISKESLISPSHSQYQTYSIASSIAQKVNISTTQLLDLRQPRHATVVFQLLLPVGLLRHPISHSRVDQSRRNAVHSDIVLRPLHCKRMCHIAHASLASTIRRRRNSFVRAVRRHGSSEDDGACGYRISCNVLPAVVWVRSCHLLPPVTSLFY